jgi:non-heme chloroperoxidase
MMTLRLSLPKPIMFTESPGAGMGHRVLRQVDTPPAVRETIFIEVLATLKINRPVLVGYSFAGQELSSVATRFPDKIAGAVYLDAAYGYAFYASLFGDIAFDLPELQDKLEQLSKSQDDATLIDKLLQLDLPRFERELQRKKQFAELISQVPTDRAGPSAADRASFAALSAWYAQNMVGGIPPEVELHLSFESNPDGSVAKPRSHPAINSQDSKWEKFATISVPVLAIFACPPDYGPSIDRDPVLREKLEAYDTADCQAQAKALEKESVSKSGVDSG